MLTMQIMHEKDRDIAMFDEKNSNSCDRVLSGDGFASINAPLRPKIVLIASEYQ